MLRKTKIIATIGPASNNNETLRQMLEAGMDGARINMSHGPHKEKAETVTALRHLVRKTGHPVTIFADLQGPKMRVGLTDPPEGVSLSEGATIAICHSPVVTAQAVGLDNPDVVTALRAGDRILLADGTITARVKSATARGIKAVVESGGLLTSRKGFAVTGRSFNIPPFTGKDKKDLAWALKAGVDAIAISFVDCAGTIEQVRHYMNRYKRVIPIIAKIERIAAMEHLDAILDVTDGVMVARGDLGVEAGIERVPVLQKDIIKRAVAAGRPVITATEMMESMTEGNRPSRAESSDVANAVFDGTDAVMLSGETAIGKHPPAVITAMARILNIAEEHIQLYGGAQFIPGMQRDDIYATLAEAMRRISLEIDLAIIIFSNSDRPIRLASRFRPNDIIYACTPRNVSHWINLIRGVVPLQLTASQLRSAARLDLALDALAARKCLKKNDLVLVFDTLTPATGATLQLRTVT